MNADLPTAVKLARTLVSQLCKENEVTAVAKEPQFEDRSNRPRRMIECWTCGAKGHISRCAQRDGRETRRGSRCADGFQAAMRRLPRCVSVNGSDLRDVNALVDSAR